MYFKKPFILTTWVWLLIRVEVSGLHKLLFLCAKMKFLSMAPKNKIEHPELKSHYHKVFNSWALFFFIYFLINIWNLILWSVLTHNLDKNFMWCEMHWNDLETIDYARHPCPIYVPSTSFVMIKRLLLCSVEYLDFVSNLCPHLYFNSWHFTAVKGNRLYFCSKDPGEL